MASLLYSQAEFQAAVDALKSYVSQLEGVLGDCEAKKAEINQFWDDASGQEYTRVINENIRVCKNAIFDTNLQITEFEKTIAGMSDIQKIEESTVGLAADVVNKLVK